MKPIYSLIHTLVFFCVFCAAAPAYAQEVCNTVTEMITKLSRVEVGAYSIWDHISGENDVDDTYTSVVVSPKSQNVFALGEIIKEKTGQGSVQLFLQEIDRRGRNVWRKELHAPNIQSGRKLMVWNDRIFVFADREKDSEKTIWMGVYDLKGQKIREKIIANKGVDLTFGDVVVAHGGKTILLAMQLTPPNKVSDPYSILYWLDEKGQVQKHRSFLLGVANTVKSILAHAQGYVLAGSIETSDGRTAGWVVNIDPQGVLHWQRPYARGKYAVLNMAQMFENDRYIALVGESYPYLVDKPKAAAWVMVLERDDGGLGWQRFYQDDAHIFGRAISAHKDGQISVLIDVQYDQDVKTDDSGADRKEGGKANDMDSAIAIKKDPSDKRSGFTGMLSNFKQDFVRLLTLNPRGIIMASKSYHQGSGAETNGMVLGYNDERIIYGQTLIEFQIEEKPSTANSDGDMNTVLKKAIAGEKADVSESEDQIWRADEHVIKKIQSDQAWIIAASANEKYNDPCRKGEVFTPAR